MAYLQAECSIPLQYNKEGFLVVKGDGVIKIDLHFFRSSLLWYLGLVQMNPTDSYMGGGQQPLTV